MKTSIDQAISNRLVILTLNMAKTDGKLAEFRYLPEDLLGDEMNAPVLWSEVNFGLKPAGTDLDATIRGGHGRTVMNGDRRKGEEKIRDSFF